jgi:hypothetical protein
MKEILLTQGKVALVDDEDYERLSKHTWQANKQQDGLYYAQRSVYHKGKRIHIKMHREILGFFYRDGKITDHKNRNGLDNQRNNLRPTTRAINRINSRMQKDNRSGFRGVSWYKRDDRWQVYIRINGIAMFFGRYIDIIDAAIAYDYAVTKYRGNNAILNFPERRLEYVQQYL